MVVIGILLVGLPLHGAAQDDPQAVAADVCASGCRFSSIQAAIDAASAGDRIRIAAGTYQEHIRLKAGVHLIGGGADSTVLQGNGSTAVVEASHNSIGRDTVLEQVAITGGGGSAAVAIGTGASPTLRLVTIRNNRTCALRIGADSNPLLEELLIRDNTAQAGAGLAISAGAATVRNSVFSNNVAAGTDGVYGSVYADSGAHLRLENTSVRGGSAPNGGAIAVINGATVDITGGTFENNQAAVQGGAFFAFNDSNLVLKGARVTRNASLDGGAITVSIANLHIDKSTISDNRASRDAGGINVILYSNVILRYSRVENNTAGRDAAGLTIQTGSEGLLEHNVVFGNVLPHAYGDTTVGIAGGIKIWGENARPTLRYNRIEANVALDGAGVYVEAGAEPILEYNEVVGNHATRHGGGLVVNIGAKPLLLGNHIVNNQADHSGGGLWIYNQSKARLEHNLIAANRANHGSGGLIIHSDLASELIDNLIVGNVASNAGGGISIINSSARLVYNRILRNRTSNEGGGIFIAGNASPIIKSNMVFGNQSGRSGDGIYVENASPDLVNNLIAGNDPNRRGDGLFLGSGGTAELVNNLIVDNGYGIRAQGGHPGRLSHNNVYGNLEDDYEGLSRSSSDMSLDPLLLAGGYLSHVSTGQNQNSPMIDAGEGSAYESGLHGTTTRVDGALDQGRVDIGFHRLPPARPQPDLSNVFIPSLQLSW